MTATDQAAPPRPPGLLSLTDSLTDDERAVQAAVRRFRDERVTPHAGTWFEAGDIPGIRWLSRGLGEPGLLGMHLTGTAVPVRARAFR